MDLQDPSRLGRIATSTLWDEGAEYSPDGRRIAFNAVTKSGLWFVGAPSGKPTYWSIGLMRFADRTITEAARLDSDWHGVSLAVSPDERYVLITRVDDDNSDPLLFNDFR